MHMTKLRWGSKGVSSANGTTPATIALPFRSSFFYPQQYSGHFLCFARRLLLRSGSHGLSCDAKPAVLLEPKSVNIEHCAPMISSLTRHSESSAVVALSVPCPLARRRRFWTVQDCPARLIK